jgi:hypothetical protein
LSQEDINNLNRFIGNNEIKAVNSLPTKKSQGPNRFTAEFYQTLKKEPTPMFLKLFHKIQREGMLPNSFYKASITLIPKPDKEIHTHNTNQPTKQQQQKKHYRPISLMNMNVKISRKYLLTKFDNRLKRSYNMIKLALFQGCKDSLTCAN